VERLREWLASKVLQPLVDACEAAHEPVNRVLAKYGQQGCRLPPLPTVLLGGSSGAAAVGPGALASGDVEAALRQAGHLAGAMAAAPATSSNPAIARDVRELGEVRLVRLGSSACMKALAQCVIHDELLVKCPLGQQAVCHSVERGLTCQKQHLAAWSIVGSVYESWSPGEHAEARLVGPCQSCALGGAVCAPCRRRW
jgi:hypothetical protein